MTDTIEGACRDKVLGVVREMIVLGRQDLVETGIVRNDGEMLGATISVLISTLCQCMARSDVETFLAEVMSENAKVAEDGSLLN